MCAHRCKICGSLSMRPFKENNIPGELSSRSFAITDASYGITGELYECDDCGFVQCTDITDPGQYYAELVDEDYEDGRSVRALQARKLLRSLGKLAPTGRLLDIGAGSGIFVE